MNQNEADSVSFDPRRCALRDGRSVLLRIVQPSDEAELLQAFERMSPDARYLRFMRSVRELDRERLRRSLGAIHAAGLSIVATVPAADGIDIVGGCVYIVDADPSRCEFAISVDAGYAGVGLASTLLRTLIEQARERGLAQMHGSVLAVNGPMLRLARRLGFAIRSDPEDASVRLCELDLRELPAD